MKQYEEIAYLKKELGWLGNKRNGRFSNVENLKRDLARVQEEHRLEEKAYIDEIEHQQIDLDNLEIKLSELKERYRVALGKEIKNPTKKKETVKVEVEKDDDGKVPCDICGERFSPQGIRAHSIACKRNQLERELKLLDEV